MSKPATSHRKPLTETERLYSYIRHKKAAQVWRGLNRNTSATARELGLNRSTIADWAKAEGWIAWADAADKGTAGAIQITHESALQKHLREVDTLLTGLRALCAQGEHYLARRFAAGADVDMIEIRQLSSAVKAAVDAGAIHFNLKTLNINHSGELTVNTDIEAIRQRLSGKIHELQVIDYGGKSKSAKAG